MIASSNINDTRFNYDNYPALLTIEVDEIRVHLMDNLKAEANAFSISTAYLCNAVYSYMGSKGTNPNMFLPFRDETTLLPITTVLVLKELLKEGKLPGVVVQGLDRYAEQVFDKVSEL